MLADFQDRMASNVFKDHPARIPWNLDPMDRIPDHSYLGFFVSFSDGSRLLLHQRNYQEPPPSLPQQKKKMAEESSGSSV